MTFGASAVTTSAPASAHTPEVSATCSTLTVALSNYTNRDEPNTITVTIDDEVVEESSFGARFDAEYPLGDPAVAHDYVVTIDALENNYDREYSDSSVPCPSEVTNTAEATVSTTPATCDVDGRLVLGESENASWGEPTATTGPAEYSVTATADTDHAFSDGERTKTFTGTLEGRLDPSEAPCATVVVPERPAPAVVVTDETTRDCDSLTQTTITTTTTTDWALNESTNTWEKTPAVVTTSSSTVTIPAEVCPTAETPPTPPTTPETPPTTPETPPTTPETPPTTPETPPTTPETPPTTPETPPTTPETPPTTPETPPTTPETPPTTPETPSTPPAEFETPPVPTTPSTPETPSTPADSDTTPVPSEALASTGTDAGAIAPIGAALLLAGVLVVLGRRFASRRTADRS